MRCASGAPPPAVNPPTSDTDGDTGGFVLLVPLGAHEQHGPHLPPDTDTRIAVALCAAAATGAADLVVGPPLTVSASDEHAGFPGTLSLGTDLTIEVLVRLARSATANDRACLGTVFVNAHGGNADAVAAAGTVWRGQNAPAAVWTLPAPPGADAHAGRTETSLMLAIDPAAVALDAAVVGDTRPLGETLPLMRTGGVRAVSASGVLGDPTGANAAEGAAAMARAVDDLIVFARACRDDWRRRGRM